MKSQIIVALDMNFSDAFVTANKLDPSNCKLKIGSQLFSSEGPKVIEEFTDEGNGMIVLGGQKSFLTSSDIDLLLPVKKGHRAALIKPEEVKGLLNAIEGYEGDEIVRSLLKLSPHFFLRPGELRNAEWPEFDLENKLWCVPACRMKIKTQDHFVPLSNQAMSILKELHSLTGHRQYLFPSPRDWKRSLSNNTANAALRRMGFRKEQMCMHGFRAIARTLLDEVLHYCI